MNENKKETLHNVVYVTNMEWGVPIKDECVDWTDLPESVALENDDSRYCTSIGKSDDNAYHLFWEAELDDDLEAMYGRELLDYEAKVVQVSY